jgi:hypothetical protein
MRRHWVGLALAAALAAAIFFGGGWGVATMSRLAAQGISLTSIPGLSALGLLMLAGLFLGILMVAPGIPPLATAVPGAALLAWTGLLALSAPLAGRLIPLRAAAFGTGFHLMLSYGVLALLGMAMICPAFVPARWHPAERGGDDDGDAEAPGRPAPIRLLS